MKKHIEAMKKAGVSLAIFALISVLLVAMTDQLTKRKIAENKATMLLQVLNEVVPKDNYDNDLVKSKFTLPQKNKFANTPFQRDINVYLATKNNQAVTAIFEVTTLQGYSGAITILVGVNAKDYTLSGVRVVQHKETPGLGDKMETRKSNWVLAFNNTSLNNPGIDGWQVKKDGGQFDQFTGATITPRAIVNAVKTTLLYAQDHMDVIFGALNSGNDKKVINNGNG